VTPGQLTALLRVVNTRVGLSVRAGGHSSVCMARPLVVDVRSFNEVRVDPSAMTVTVQAGCTNRDVDDACAPHGLAVTLGNASTVGAIGAMLGGGVGFLARWSGLTIDALVSCRVVLADGNIVDCDGDRHPDLFWALRGGGGNFGIVLECTLRAVPVGWDARGRMFAGARVVRHSQRGCCGNGIGAVEAFKAWRDYAVNGAPDCVSLDCVLPCGGPMVQQYTYKGPIDDAKREAQAWKAFGTAAVTDLKPRSYHHDMQRDLMKQIGSKLPMPHKWRVAILESMPDEVVEALLCAVNQDRPNSDSLVHCERLGGKISEGNAGCFLHREGQFWVSMVGIYGTKGKVRDVARVDAWLDRLCEQLRPHCLTMSGGGMEPHNVFGLNTQRLQQVKQDFDPDNVFSAVENGFSGAHNLLERDAFTI
jgi:hypothetical protein